MQRLALSTLKLIQAVQPGLVLFADHDILTGEATDKPDGTLIIDSNYDIYTAAFGKWTLAGNAVRDTITDSSVRSAIANLAAGKKADT